MVHLTRYFSEQAPLSPRLKSALDAAFDGGWADPKKLSQASGRAAILRNQALEELAHHLAISPDQIEPLGEPALGHYLAIAALLKPSTPLTTSSVDVGKIRAVARTHQGPTHQIEVGPDGRYLALADVGEGVISLQAVNGETGITQKLEAFTLSKTDKQIISLDATHAIPTPGLTSGASTALFSASSWSGITGMGFLVIGDRADYQYPLPHIAPISVPGSYSLPLLIASVVALTEYKEKVAHIASLRQYSLSKFRGLPSIHVIEGNADSTSQYISLLVEGFASEEILKKLAPLDIAIDAGSACSPEDLAPSHVIAAMGLPTTGHLRITLHPHHTEGDIDFLAESLAQVLS